MKITKLKELFGKPRIIGVIGDVNSGKSNLLYDIITTLKQDTKFTLYTYGLRNYLGMTEQKIYSVEELEIITNSVIIIDEFNNLFDIDDRKKRRLIESTLRLIHHNNNILILTGLPENFKKFVSAKLSVIFFKICTLADFINGSRIKNVAFNYKGIELGSAVLNIGINETLIFDGQHYVKSNVKYFEQYDTKRYNQPILKNVEQTVQGSVSNIVQKEIKN